MPLSLSVKEKASQSLGVQEGLQHDVAKQYDSELHVQSMERMKDHFQNRKRTECVNISLKQSKYFTKTTQL